MSVPDTSQQAAGISAPEQLFRIMRFAGTAWTVFEEALHDPPSVVAQETVREQAVGSLDESVGLNAVMLDGVSQLLYAGASSQASSQSS